jgi:hypothetical protein
VSFERRAPWIIRALVAGTAVLAAFATLSAPAGAAVPCWKRVVADWGDGRIDRTYPTTCYAAALNHLPTDVRNYTDAADQIRRALFASVGRDRDASPPAGSDTRTMRSAPAPVQQRNTGRTAADPTEDPLQQAVGLVASKNPGSVPLPLIVAGAIGFFLLAAVAARLLQQRSARVFERLRH